MDIIEAVKKYNLKYVDKRGSGGDVWVIGGLEISSTIARLRELGFAFSYIAGGVKSSNYNDAWWCMGTSNNVMSQSDKYQLTRPADAHTEKFHSLSAPSTPVTVSPKTTLRPMAYEMLSQILSARFANGFRIDSHIELERFRAFAAEDLHEEISLPDDEIRRLIEACGMLFDGKIYVVSTQTKERIKRMASAYFESGAQVIFYDEFYAKNEKWLFGGSVISADMLVSIFHKLFWGLSFTQHYFGNTNESLSSVLEKEILRVWGDDLLLTYDQLAERLQYIPIERIKYALSQNGDFIWNSAETYLHISRIYITKEEREIIREDAGRKFGVRDFFFITDLPFDEIAERYHELSITAIHDSVFRICLSDKYDKRSKSVTRKGNAIDALAVMKYYCGVIDKCSLDELLYYAKALTGKEHRWIPMEAGNAVLVRIDKDAYVADKYVSFDSDAIDEAINLFVKGEYLPLKSFTTFGSFPDCGQKWNLFLLESYCRRFSKKFRFDTVTVNSRNAGAVIRKNCDWTYELIMSHAVARAKVPLESLAVGKFLTDSGYTGKKSTAGKIGEIIENVKNLREVAKLLPS